MSIEPSTFNLSAALQHWLIAVLACTAIAIALGFVFSLIAGGLSGPRTFWKSIRGGLSDISQISVQRVGALASLTMKEAISRKALMIGGLFVLLFMFGGWFLGSSDQEKPALPYITFVMSAMYFLLCLMALLISCWGLPADIKAKSMHTIVTKPVRRSEIVIGRILGYSAIVLSILSVTAIFGYVWILRQVPKESEAQMVARVPAYGDLGFLDRNGEAAEAGINVGYTWEYRSYIEGLTKARAIWTFENLNVDELKGSDHVRFEQSFEAFRTYKGDIEEEIRYQITLVNPSTDLRVTLPDTYPVHEFSDDPELSVVRIPEKLEYIDSYERDAKPKQASLFNDIFDGNSLTVEIACVDDQQYIGCAEGDLFIRMKDRSFLTSYVKANVGLALMLILVVAFGTTSSCFLKGPVSTFLTGTVIILGNSIYTFIAETEKSRTDDGGILGGGVLESVYRLVFKMNQTTELPDNLGFGKNIIEFLDENVFNVLFFVKSVIPNFSYFNTSRYAANGFDVPWTGALLPSILTTIGFIIPLIIIGYFSLQFRELEHK